MDLLVIEKLKNEQLNKQEYITQVKLIIESYIKTSKINNKKFGEVFTPIFLVEEMLDKLPIEVWSNPNLKWLDPCNGFGTFYTVVIERLMKGLEDFEPNIELRYKHIINNMIYACELQEDKKNMFKYIFECVNIYNGSYLDGGFDKQMELWNINKFDIIVQNPPYNTSPVNGKTQALWNKFVLKTIEQLVEGGYMVAVHPAGWRDVDGKYKPIQNILKSKQLLYLEVHNLKDGLKTFGASTSYDFYCLHNIDNYKPTTIKFMDGIIEDIDIKNLVFIPNGMFKQIMRLIEHNEEDITND